MFFASLATSAPHPSITELTARADSGDLVARKLLFQFLLHADPASPEFTVAVDCLRSLASQDDVSAELPLGYLYDKGRGVPRDYSQAAADDQTSALHGNAFAQNNLAFLYQHGLGSQRSAPPSNSTWLPLSKTTRRQRPI